MRGARFWVVVLAAVAGIVTQKVIPWSSREPKSKVFSAKQGPQLKYKVKWKYFEEPLRESLLRPTFVQLSRNDTATTEFIQSVRIPQFNYTLYFYLYRLFQPNTSTYTIF